MPGKISQVTLGIAQIMNVRDNLGPRKVARAEGSKPSFFLLQYGAEVQKLSFLNAWASELIYSLRVKTFASQFDPCELQPGHWTFGGTVHT